MDELQLLVDLHKDGARQGPGGDPETRLALGLSMLTAPAAEDSRYRCGTGAATLVLARELNAQITAVDFLQDFLDVLENRAKAEGLSGKISTLCRSMDDLPFSDGEFDAIWSEGAIYNIGFEKGLRDWRRYLKTGGILAVSEITWTTAARPSELQAYWEREYPEIGVASTKMAQLENCGYAPLGYFVLPEHCWLDNYYRPMQQRFERFLEQHGGSEDARAIVESEAREIALYEKYKAYYSYGVYIARKLG